MTNPFQDLIPTESQSSDNPFGDLIPSKPVEEQSIFGDMWDSFKTGALSMLQGDLETANLITGDDVTRAGADKLKGYIDETQEGMSSASREAMQKEFITEDEGGYGLGDAWSDPRAFANIVASGFGSLAGMFATGGPLKGALSWLGKKGVKSTADDLLKSGAAKNADEAADMAVKRLKIIDRTSGAAGYGIAEGAAVGGLTAADIKEGIDQMPDEQIMSAPIFQGIMAENPDLSFAEAKEQLKQGLAEQGALTAGIPSALVGAIFGPYMEKMLLGKVGASTRTGAFAKGAVAEGIPESIQGGMEQVAQNVALGEVDPTITPMQGVANAAVAEGIGGMSAGGVLGAITGKVQQTKTVEEAIGAADAAAGSPLTELSDFEGPGLNSEPAAPLDTDLSGLDDFDATPAPVTTDLELAESGIGLEEFDVTPEPEVKLEPTEDVELTDFQGDTKLAKVTEKIIETKGDEKVSKAESAEISEVLGNVKEVTQEITPKKRDHYNSEGEARRALEMKHRLTNAPEKAAELKDANGEYNYEPVEVEKGKFVLRRKGAKGSTYTPPAHETQRFDTEIIRAKNGDDRILVKGSPEEITARLDAVGIPRMGRLASKKLGGIQVPIQHQELIEQEVSGTPVAQESNSAKSGSYFPGQTTLPLLEAKQYLKDKGIKSMQVNKILRKVEPISMDEAGRDAKYVTADLDAALESKPALTNKQAYKLIDHLEKDLAPVGKPEIQKAFPSGRVRETQGGYTVKLPNGINLQVNTDQTIEIDEASARKAYGKNYPKNAQAVGSFQKLDKDAVIALAKGADQATVPHEAFHTAFQMALTPFERSRLLKRYGSEEGAASAYESWNPQEANTLFNKIMKFFRRIAGAFSIEGTFEKVRDGKVFDRPANREVQEATKSFKPLSTRPLNLITLRESVRVAETGEVVEIEMRADAALNEIDDEIAALENIKVCLA